MLIFYFGLWQALNAWRNFQMFIYACSIRGSSCLPKEDYQKLFSYLWIALLKTLFWHHWNCWINLFRGSCIKNNMFTIAINSLHKIRPSSQYLQAKIKNGFLQIHSRTVEPYILFPLARNMSFDWLCANT